MGTCLCSNLRPDFSNLPCLFSTFQLEYPSVLSLFYLSSVFMNKSIRGTRQIIRYRATATLRRSPIKHNNASNEKGLQHQREHHIILTKYEAVHPTGVLIRDANYFDKSPKIIHFKYHFASKFTYRPHNVFPKQCSNFTKY